MATKLDKILARPIDRAPRITVTGDAGVGKTTLACLFPKPVVLRVEDGVESIPEARRPYSFPVVKTFDEALGYLRMLRDEEHPFQTLVVDSVTRLGTLIEAELIASDPRKPRSINQAFGGYGAGANAAAERHRVFTSHCEELNDAGMTIIYTAHASVEQIDPPDADSYTRFNLRLPRQSTAHYVDNVDAVCFIKLRTRYITREEEKRKRVRADDTRIIIMHSTGAHVSKNRYGVTEDIEWNDASINPIIEFIPFYASQQQAAKRSASSVSRK
jgi:hypothetical protein